MLNEELADPSSVQSYHLPWMPAKLVGCLIAKLAAHLTT